jgi:hypothetical protein
MGRVAQRQANIRLDETIFDKVESAAFIHRRSIAEELRVAIVAWVDALEGDPRMTTLGGLARDPVEGEHADEEGGQVSSLDAKRKRSRRRPDA